MTVQVTRDVLVELFEACRFYNKEAKKLKERREQMKKLEDNFRQYHNTLTAAETIEIDKNDCISFLQIFILVMQQDNLGKVVEHNVRLMRSLLVSTRMLNLVLPHEVDAAYGNVRNIATLLVGIIPNWLKYYPKQLQMSIDAYQYILLSTNDVHHDEMKQIGIAIVKLLICFPTNAEIKHLQILYIQQLSQKYQLSKYDNPQNPLQNPVNYQKIEIDSVYSSDYKNWIIFLDEQLKKLNDFTFGALDIASYQQQCDLKLDFQITQIERITFVIGDLIYWTQRLIPISALQDTYYQKMFQSFVLNMVCNVLHQQSTQNQESYLFTIENLIRTFFGQFSNQFIFEHFNNFILRVLKTKEIPHNQLKMIVLAHLIRLISQDNNEYGYNEMNTKTYESQIQAYKLVDPLNLLNCTENDQRQYFALFQRRFMPPGMMLQLLFINYDAQFTQPNLVQTLFKVLNDQYKYANEQPVTKEVIEQVSIYKLYYPFLKANLLQQLIKMKPENPLYQNMVLFSRACGIPNLNYSSEYIGQLNSFYDMDFQVNDYKLVNYAHALLQTLARLQTELSNSYLCFQYNVDSVKFVFDFDLPFKIESDEKRIEIIKQNEETMKQKNLMQVGYEKFDEAPLKAIDHFRANGFLDKFKVVEDGDNIMLCDELQKAYENIVSEQVSETLKSEQTKVEPVKSEGGKSEAVTPAIQVVEEPKRKKRRNFEEEYLFNLQQIATFMKQYKNADQCFKQIIQFVLKYQKKSDYSVGLSKSGLGELIGGSKVENRCCLFFFVQYFIEQVLTEPNYPFVSAIRAFLGYFRLPGEGQVIDRIVSFFSGAYAKNANMDHKTIHGLTYAVIMLNTDLHNSSMKDRRMDKQTFLRNTKLIDYAQQLTDTMLEEIYDEILVRPFTLGSIEELKKWFYLLARYVNIETKQQEEKKDEKKDNNEGQEIDVEAEMIKNMPAKVRYGKAFLEWVQYGSTYHNQDIQDSLLEVQQLTHVFSFSMWNKMISQTGNTTIQNLLDYISKQCAIQSTTIIPERQPNVLFALKINLLMMFSEKINLPKLAHEQLRQYIIATGFLNVNIIQYKNFDMSILVEQMINLDTTRQNKFIKNPGIIIKISQVELLAQITDMVKQLCTPAADPANGYSGRLKILTAWTDIMEVFSRIFYFFIVTNKQMTKDHRNTLVSQDTEAYKKLLQLDIQQCFQSKPISSAMMQNLVIIDSNLIAFKVYEIQNSVMNNLDSLPHDEKVEVAMALSTVSQVELNIQIMYDYSLRSSKYLTSILFNLIRQDIQLFEECFVPTMSHYQDIYNSKQMKIPEMGFDNIKVVITQFLSEQSRKLTKREDIIAHLDREDPLWVSILQPINLCLAPDSSKNLLFSVLKEIPNYTNFIELNKQRQKELAEYIQSPYGVTDQDVLGFSEIYSSLLTHCVLPKIAIELLISMCQQAADKQKETGLKQFSMDVTLSLQAQQQNVKQDVKQSMEQLEKTVTYFQTVIESLFFNCSENYLRVTERNASLVKKYVGLLNNIRQQRVIGNVSENVQKIFFSFIENIFNMILKTFDVTRYDQEQCIVSISTSIGEVIENILTDDRQELRVLGVQKTQELFRRLFSTPYGRNAVHLIIEPILLKFHTQYLKDKKDINKLFCRNLTEDRVACGCENYLKHCQIEIIVDQLVYCENEDNIRMNVATKIFDKMLFTVCKVDKPVSIINILEFMIRKLSPTHAQYILDEFSKQDVKNSNIPDYVALLSVALAHAQHDDAVVAEGIKFCCNVKRMAALNEDVFELDQLFTQILKVFKLVSVDVQCRQDVVAAFIEFALDFLRDFLPHQSKKVDLMKMLLQFFSTMDDQHFKFYYQAAIFDAIIDLINSNDEEIRKAVIMLLKEKYQPIQQVRED